MKWSSQFFSENLLLSVGGHLALAAIIVTSMGLVFERARMVTPDRIQIMEIDLNAVRVSGDETRLRNINAEMEPTPPPVVKDPPKPAPEPVVDDVPAHDIDAPALVTPDAPVPETPTPPTPVKNDDTPAPVPPKKTVVRVNRSVMSLDRTLTVSVADALRVAMTRCWVIDATRFDMNDIRVVARMTMRRNGTVRDVWFESAARADTDAAFAYVLETIRDAINACQPFNMLPVAEFEKWEKIQLTFYPTQGRIM